ncbi:sorting nexin-13 [Anaeramoeba flamelloides]|uniref:Sorting nexin-13 n=1 Tax=Anaeramoeba flamelloides TaxID=1746091 RepID=A0AAV7YDR6_9EUKA|nr:sorting nexin-13 [Anaeramoeba flamelloides]
MLYLKIIDAKQSEGKKSFTTYGIRAKTKETSWTFWTRYSEMRILNKTLTKQFPYISLPFPPKKRIKKKAENFLKKRTQLLQNFLNDLLLEPEIIKSQAFQEFLQINSSKTSLQSGLPRKSELDFFIDSSQDGQKIGVQELNQLFEQLDQDRISRKEKINKFLKSQEFNQIAETRRNVKIMVLTAERSHLAKTRGQIFIDELVGSHGFVKENISLIDLLLTKPGNEMFEYDVIVFATVDGEIAKQTGNIMTNYLQFLEKSNRKGGVIICYGSNNSYYGISGGIQDSLPTKHGEWISGNEITLGEIHKFVNAEDLKHISDFLLDHVEMIKCGESGRSQVTVKEGSHLLVSWSDNIPLLTLKNNFNNNKNIKIVDLNFFPADFSVSETDGLVLVSNVIDFVSGKSNLF